MKKGEIYNVDLGNVIGSEQGGKRPCIIVQNDIGNEKSTTTIICPLTTKSKANLPTHLKITTYDCGINKDSTILCEQIRVIEKSRILFKITELKNVKLLNELDKKLKIALGI